MLSLRHCHISENLRRKFNPTGLRYLNSNLEKLNLSANDLGYSCRLSSLAPSLPVGLKSLVLQGNHLGEVRSFQELHEFINGLVALKNLHFLDLFQNNLCNLSIESWVILLNSMRNIKKLKSLNLEENHLQTLSGKDLAYIVRAIPQQVKFLNFLGEASYPQHIGVFNINEALSALLSDLDVHNRTEYYVTQLIFRLRPLANASCSDFDKVKHPNLTDEQILKMEEYLLKKQTRVKKLAYRYIQYLKNKLSPMDHIISAQLSL